MLQGWEGTPGHDPWGQGHSSHLGGTGPVCPPHPPQPGWHLTIRGAASFRWGVQLVGIWGTALFQSPFSLLFLFLIVHSAAT